MNSLLKRRQDALSIGGVQTEYAPGLSPTDLADLADPVLLALTGRRVSKDAVRASIGWPPQPRSPRQRKGKPSPQPHPQHPYLRAFQHRQGGAYYPDQVVDTEENRLRDSEDLLTRLESLALCYPGGLKLFRLTLPELDDCGLYDPITVQAARKAAQAWLKTCGLRGEWKLERGLCGGTHLHIVTCASAAKSGVPVYDLGGLAKYLVKPADARACLPKRNDSRRRPERLADLYDAAKDYLRAQAAMHAGQYGNRQRLPRMRERA